MKSWRVLSVMFAAAGLGVSMAAQSPPASPPGSQHPATTFRASTSMVALNVTVTRGHDLVTGLSREQFAVLEDGVPQNVQFFESTGVPLDLILLLDASSSMQHRMATVHQAAMGFMKVLRSGDRGAVVAFSDQVKVMQDLTSDHQAIAGAISATTASGATALHNAIYVSLKEFGRRALAAGEVRRQALAVLSDGEDTSSVIPFESVVELARRMGVSVYTISLQSAGSRVTRPNRYTSQSTYALHELARETGARAFFPAGVHELQSVYAAIAAELAAQYSIGYLPADSRIDGRFRRIQVSIPGSPELTSRTRTGYTAERVRTVVNGF